MSTAAETTDAPAVGEPLPSFTLSLTLSRVVTGATASRDFYPAHHDPEFAHAQGQRAVYANTAVIEGLVDRVVTDWAGPDVWIVQRAMRMAGSLYAGDDVTAAGTVAAVWNNPAGTRLADVDVTLVNSDGVQVTGRVTLAWLGAGGDERFPVDRSGGPAA